MKRIVAWAGIIVLVLLYVLTFISACADWKYSANMFWACIYCTIMIPIIMHIVLRIHAHVVERRNYIIDEMTKDDDKDEK